MRFRQILICVSFNLLKYVECHVHILLLCCGKKMLICAHLLLFVQSSGQTHLRKLELKVLFHQKKECRENSFHNERTNPVWFLGCWLVQMYNCISCWWCKGVVLGVQSSGLPTYLHWYHGGNVLLCQLTAWPVVLQLPSIKALNKTHLKGLLAPDWSVKLA